MFAEAVPVETALGTLASHGVLGLVAALAIWVAIWAVRAMREETHLRNADVKEYAALVEALAEKDRAMQMENARLNAALAEAQRETTKAIDRLTRALEDNTRSVEGVVRDALRSRARSGDSTQMPAVRDPRDPRSR